ncbi:MAG: TonB family protein [Proteobacteria bacterium]|nr:TonB family protein [Pseudomonadota bacterium]
MLHFLSPPTLRHALLLSLAAHLVLLSLLTTELPEAGIQPALATMRALLISRNDGQNLSPAPPAKSIVAASVPDTTPRHPSHPLTPSKPTVATTNTESVTKAGGENVPASGLDTAQPTSSFLAQSGETGNTGTSAEGLRAYRLALGREARRLKLEYDRKYSQIERDLQKGWEGRVEMNVRTDSTGTTVLLTRSSGHATLDDQALDLISRAVRHTALPDSLRGQHFLLPVALEFEINKE